MPSLWQPAIIAPLLSLIFSITVAIFKQDKEETDNLVANVFPNPAKDEINFILETPVNINQIEIFDLLGRNIFISHQNIKRYSDSIKIDISTLPTGVYYCMIKSDNFDFTQTFSVLKDWNSKENFL